MVQKASEPRLVQLRTETRGRWNRFDRDPTALATRPASKVVASFARELLNAQSNFVPAGKSRPRISVPRTSSRRALLAPSSCACNAGGKAESAGWVRLCAPISTRPFLRQPSQLILPTWDGTGPSVAGASSAQSMRCFDHPFALGRQGRHQQAPQRIMDFMAARLGGPQRFPRRRSVHRSPLRTVRDRGPVVLFPAQRDVQ